MSWTLEHKNGLSLLAGFGHSRTLGVGFPTLRKKGKPSRKRRACILGSCQAEMAAMLLDLGQLAFAWLVG